MNPILKFWSLVLIVTFGCALGLSACGSGAETETTGSLVADEQSTGGSSSVEVTQPDTTVAANDSKTSSSVLDIPSAPDISSASNATDQPLEVVPLRFESQIDDVSASELEQIALAVLNDERGWVNAGFQFVADPDSVYRVVLAEGDEIDRLCLPLKTGGTVSCQNGPVVALNADRWRTAVPHWDAETEDYRGYLVNHEVGHLIGQRHPQPRCPVAGRPAGVMEQQTGGLKGCVGNAWPRDWELEMASSRPVVYAPLPDWAPSPVPQNSER